MVRCPLQSSWDRAPSNQSLSGHIGPLLQRASTVISAPIKGVTAPLKILMSPQIPHDYSGSWVTYAGVSNQAFNDTVPTIFGDRSNHVEGLPVREMMCRTLTYV